MAVSAMAACSPVASKVSSSRSVGCGEVSRASLIRLSVTPAIAEITATTRQPLRCVSMSRRATFANSLRSSDGSAAVFLDDQAHGQGRARMKAKDHGTGWFSLMFRRCQLAKASESARRTKSDCAQHIVFVRRHGCQLRRASSPHRDLSSRVRSPCKRFGCLPGFPRTNRRLARRIAAFEKPGDRRGTGRLHKNSFVAWQASVALREFRRRSRCRPRRAIPLRRACAASQLAGFPMRIAEAIVSGFFDDSIVKDRRGARRLKADHGGQPRRLSGLIDIRDNRPNRR